MCRSMVDIQSVTAEIRRGKKELRKKEEETTVWKYNGLPYSIGDHNNSISCTTSQSLADARCWSAVQ